MRSGRIKKRRSHTPDNSKRPGVLRRKEKALKRIAKTVLRTILRINRRRFGYVFDVKEIVLRNNRHDCAQNQVPISADRDGNDRLNVKRELITVV